MIDASDIPELVGATVFDSSGDKIGKVGQVYLDDRSGAPQWVTVSTGLFGTRETFVPVQQARYADGALSVPVSKATVKDAPSIDEDGHLSPEQEQELYSHYGLPRDNADTQTAPPPDAAADSGTTDPDSLDSSRSDDSADSSAPDSTDSTDNTDSTDSTDSTEVAGVETMAMGAPPEATRGEGTDPAGRDEANTSLGARAESGPDSVSDSDPADGDGDGDGDGVTLSAQQLHADTERVPTSRARLRKYVVTRMETVEVPVSREEVRLEREPISEEEAASMPAGEIGESDLEMILYEERVVVTKQTVPVERIRVATDTVTDTRTVSEEVQAEQVEFDHGDRGGQDRLPRADS